MSPWTAEILERAIELTKSGVKPAIAARLLNEEFHTAISRNALLGKMYRVGHQFTSRHDSPRKPRSRVHVNPATFRRPASVVSLPPMHITDRPLPTEFLCIEFENLESGQCRYPRGETAPYVYCGQPVRNYSESWCENCRKIVYARPQITDEEHQRRVEWGRQLGALQRAARKARAA